MNAVALAVGREAGHEEAREAPVRLGEHEEPVAHRGREEPLVAGDLVLAPRTAAVQWRGGGRVRAHVRAALLLRHPHTAPRALLVRRRDEALAVVFERRETWLPLGGHLGLLAQRRDDRIGHG